MQYIAQQFVDFPNIKAIFQGGEIEFLKTPKCMHPYTSFYLVLDFKNQSGRSADDELCGLTGDNTYWLYHCNYCNFLAILLQYIVDKPDYLQFITIVI